ncbi:MAG: spermidine/putrescine ABC transporter substrate-binding protein [Archaeoglobaceae archaeon]|nr:spermidine/putrescine ABC transporter substrate-binding protein [Archaeoglobaceae archaeon]
MVNERRRRFIKIAVAGIVGLSLAGFAGYLLRGGRVLEELRIYNWSYYINENLLDEFSKQSGIKIIYHEYDDPNIVLTKLEAGKSGYDIVILPDYCVDIAIKKNLLLELNKKLIPNTRYLDEKFLDLPYDPGGKFSIVYMWGSTGFAWRKGVEDVTTLQQIFNPEYGFLPKYRGKITMLEEAAEVICFCKAYLGRRIDDWSDETLAEVKEALIKQKPYLAAYAGTTLYYEGLKTGTIYVAQAYNGDIARLREEFSDVFYGVPEEGGTIWTDNMCIPKDASQVEVAHEFINFLLDPEVAEANSQFIGYANPVKDSQQFLGELLEDPVVYPPEEIQKKMWLMPSLTDEERKKIEDLMLEVKAA